MKDILLTRFAAAASVIALALGFASVFTGIEHYRSIPGTQGAWILRRSLGDTTEILTFSLWDSMEAVRAFAGENPSRAVFYPEDERFLRERGETVQHYTVS